MVKKTAKYVSLFLAGLTVLCIVGVGALVGTENGSRWLLSYLKGLADVNIEFSSSEGRLADHLILHELRLSWQGGTLGIEEVELEWSPWKLPFRQLDIVALALKNPVYQSLGNTSDPKPFERPVWPELPSWLQRWQVDIAKLSMTQATYLPPDAQSFILDGEGHDICFANGVVTIEELEGRHLDYISTGTLTLNLVKPGIEGQVSFSSTESSDELHLLFNLQNNFPEYLLNGPVSARIITAGWPEHRLSSDLYLQGDKLSLVGLNIEQADISGHLGGQLDIGWSGNPTINGSLDISQWRVSLPQETIVLDGTMTAAGPLDSIFGQYDLAATGSKVLSGRLTGDWQLTADVARIDIRRGTWLGSELSGGIHMSLQQPEEARLDFRIRGLDPSHFASDWSGRVNLEAEAVVSQLDNEPHVEFDARFIDSRLRGLPLNGVARGSWRGEVLTISQADFSGDGFRLAADGSLDSRLNVAFEISSLGAILPDAQGQLSGRGWFGLRNGNWVGDLSTAGQKLQYDRLAFDAFTVSLVREEHNLPANISLAIQALGYGNISLQSVEVVFKGDQGNHEITASTSFMEGSVQSSVFGQMTADGWQGTVRTFDIQHAESGDWILDSPALAKIGNEGYRLDTFSLVGRNGRLSLSGGLNSKGVPQQLALHVERVPLPLISTVFAPLSLTGELDMTLQCDRLSCHVETSGLESVSLKDRSVAVETLWFQGDWDQDGLHAELNVELADKAHLSGSLVSKAPLQRYEPLPLEWAFTWQGLPLIAMADLPAHMGLSGTWQGNSTGSILNSATFRGEIQASLDSAVLTWADEDSGPVEFSIDEAFVGGAWQHDMLSGSLNLAMAERGQLSSSWQLPIPARWPVEPVSNAEISGHLGGWFTEKGLIGLLWPDIVQDTRGDVEIDTHLEGVWREPQLRGELLLRNGHAYIPAAGITLNPIEVRTQFKDDQFLVEFLTVESSPGKLSATGRIDLEGWVPKGMDLSLQGQDFTLIDLPELRVRANPNLTLSGTKDELLLSGDIGVPYFLAIARGERSPVQRSPDVIIVGHEPEATDKELPFTLKTNVRLTLGEQVLVDMFGLNARLGGQLELTDIDRQHFTGAGLIEVLEGTYSTYGVKLRIDKGRATYANGPLDNPAIDILALRDIGDTKAGVQVRGTAKAPQVKLYSEPSLPDTDILSLIVLGRPLDQAGGETDPLMLAAGALLSAGDSVVLRNQLQSKLGLDSIAAESEGGETSDTILRLGKYLTPDLYLSYGYALFGQRSEVGLRYRIHKGWEAESNFGLESGADLIYRFDFD